MAHFLAAAIRSTGAKRETQFERLAVALNIHNSQRIIPVGTSFGASVPSEQVNPSSTYVGLKGGVFVREKAAIVTWLGAMESRLHVARHNPSCDCAVEKRI